jgi:nucleoside-diphosphate-sugar epimerase
LSREIVVTGGSGFLGSVLIERLLVEGYNVHNLDLMPAKAKHQRLKTTIIDITDADAVSRLALPSSADFVHLAGRQYVTAVPRSIRSSFFAEGNITGTQNMINLAKKVGAASFLFVSTDMVYGRPQHSPVGINHPRNPFGPYGASKVAAEDMLTSQDLPFRSVIFRPRLILGPGRFGLMTKLFDAIRSNMPVPMIGSGQNTYQMVSVFDCADAIVRGINTDAASGVFNLGSKAGDTSKVMIRELIRKVGSKSVVLPVPSFLIKPLLRALDRVALSPLVPEQFEIADQDYVLDVSRTKTVLGWEPVGNDAELMLSAYQTYCRINAEGR